MNEAAASARRAIAITGDVRQGLVISGDGNVVHVYYSQGRLEEPPEPAPAAEKTPANPYKGLMAFDERDADRFFGREEQVARLWERFTALFAPNQPENTLRILPVLGPSGSGKSSLLRAGLIPEIAKHRLEGLDRPRVAVMTPGAHPCEALAGVLAALATGDPIAVAKKQEFLEVLLRRGPEGRHEGLRSIADMLPDIIVSPLVLVVDQFEEAYVTPQGKEERERFEADRDALVANLLDAAGDRGGRVIVVLGMRSDFLGATSRHQRLNGHIARAPAFLVPAMIDEELAAAIRKPAERAGRPLPEGVVRLLVEQTHGRVGALPLLQFALQQIWDAHPKDPATALEDLGGVGGALARHAQTLFDALPPEDQAIARRAFLAMVSLGEGAEDTRRRVPLSDITAAGESEERVRRVLGPFTDYRQRLVTLSAASEENASVVAEPTHEALISHWGSLRDWLAQDREDLRFHRRLADAAKEWEAGRASMWRGADLTRLKDFARRRDMSALETRFFKRSRMWQWITWGGAAAMIVCLFIAGGFAYQREADLRAETQKANVDLATTIDELKRTSEARDKALAQANENLAEARRNEVRFQTALSREELKNGHPVPAMLLARRALPSGPDDRTTEYFAGAERALWSVWQRNHERHYLAGHTSTVNAVAFAPDGKRLATASYDNTARLWDAETGEALATLEGHTGPVRSVAFAPDGKRLATASYDNTARLWDAETGEALATLEGHTGDVYAVAFAPDGKRLATASDDHTARLWDAETGEALATLEGHTNTVWSVAFAPDGRRLATASLDNTARLWDAETGEALATLEGHTGPVNAVAFAPDGKRLATASYDNTARLWDAETGEALATLEGHTKDVNAVAFAPDGKRLATASYDNTARIWRVFPDVWDLIATARESLSRDWFTEEEKARFFIEE